MKRIAVVDTRLIAYMAYHRKEDFLKTFYYVSMYLSGYGKFDKIVFAYDSELGSQRRKKLYPEYKMHRREREKKQSPQEQARLKQFNEDYNKMFEFTKHFITSIKIDGLEADDIANIITDKFNDSLEIYLLSSDSDWSMNLVNDNIKQIHLTKGLITLDNVFEAYGKLPEHNVFIQALCGIAKENVKGVYKFGETRVKKMLYEQNMSETEIIEQVQEWVSIGKYGMRLPEGFNSVREMFDFNYELLRGLTLNDLTGQELETFKRQFMSSNKLNIEEVNKLCVDIYGKSFYDDYEVLETFDLI